MRSRRPGIALAAALTLALAAPLRAQPATDAAACVAASAMQVLQPAEPMASRAVFIGARHLRWPGPAGEGGYRLLHAGARPLRAVVGEPATGVDEAIALQADAPGPPPELAARFRHVAAGVDLRIADADLPRLGALLRGQLVLVQEDAAGRVLRATGVQLAGALDAIYARAGALDDLGVTPGPARTAWRLWAPTAQRVALCLHPAGAGSVARLLPMQRDDATGSWQHAEPGDLSGGTYTVLVDVFAPGHGWVRNRVTDPYAASLTADSARTAILRLDDPALGPPGWRQRRPARQLASGVDQVIYELHVRDFSITDASVRPAWRGKYLAFDEPASAGVRHLRALAAAGVTDVHLLPVFDIATIPERGCIDTSQLDGTPDGEAQQLAVASVGDRACFNWGYDPWHFSAPEGSYATDAEDPAVRIREFRRMVLALHRMGLRVGMDVVYNHMAASGQRERAVLDRIVPGYYHRLDAEGAVERSTCCDNTATEHMMMGKLVLDSLQTWAVHHGIDAFRFDLMGHMPRELLLRARARLKAATGRDIPLIGEGWNFGEVANHARFRQAVQGALDGSGIATFSDRMRDHARGSFYNDDNSALTGRRGWLQGPAGDDREAYARSADIVRAGLAGSLRDYAMPTADGGVKPLAALPYGDQGAGYVSAPDEVVNYVENHDNATLFDLGLYKLPPDTSPEDRARVQVLGAALVAFSQGVAYLHAGQEILRSKSMDRNSYASGDWFNRVDWSLRTNHFPAGLPPRAENGAQWPLIAPRLADARLVLGPAQIRFARDATLDLLRIRASSRLFRLRTAADVKARLRFPNSGPSQDPAVLAGHLQGRGLAGARWREIAYFINSDTTTRTLAHPELAGRDFRLHPVQAAASAGDPRAREARYRREDGRFTIPPRTAVVFVAR